MAGTRRWFLRWLGWAAAASALLPALARAKSKKVGLPLAKVPALQDVDGSAILKIKEQEILLIRTGAQEMQAVSSVCTHHQCQVGYDVKTRQIACPCHGSRYSVDGKVIKGPAPQDLHNYNAKLSGDQIVLEIDQAP